MAAPHGRSIAFAVSAGLTGVALGAFGAHALRATLEATARLDAWRTAVEYQLIHAAVLLALGLFLATDADSPRSRRLQRAADLFAAGIVLFSGSIYLLALGGPRWLGPITPLGGLCLLAGWATLGFAFWGPRAKR